MRISDWSSDVCSSDLNATYRELNRAVEDVRINHVEGCPWYSGDWPIMNPGETTTLWCPDTNDWVTFDSSQDGYEVLCSGNVMGYKRPKRTYKAVEFQLDRAWDDKWALNVSYLWSKSEGNRSEEHTYELQSLMRISYAVFSLKKNKRQNLKT